MSKSGTTMILRLMYKHYILFLVCLLFSELSHFLKLKLFLVSVGIKASCSSLVSACSLLPLCLFSHFPLYNIVCPYFPFKTKTAFFIQSLNNFSLLWNGGNRARSYIPNINLNLGKATYPWILISYLSLCVSFYADCKAVGGCRRWKLPHNDIHYK